MTDKMGETHDDATLDRSLLAELWQAGSDDGGFVVMLIDEFLVEGAAHVSALTDASAPFDPIRIRAAAHSLKGSAGTLGAQHLAARCQDIEDHMRQHPERAIGAELMTALDQEFVRVRAALGRERDRARGLGSNPDEPIGPGSGKVAP